MAVVKEATTTTTAICLQAFASEFPSVENR